MTGATLVECIHHYFRQSEQLEAGIKLAVAGDRGWRAGVLMLQRLPGEGLDDDGEEGELETADDGWRRALALMASATSAELTDPALAPNDLLYRLFHEDGVRVFETHPVEARCRCSRERIAGILRSFPETDIEEMRQEKVTTVTCEFCNTRYEFTPDELAPLDS